MRKNGAAPVLILVVDDDADMRLYIRTCLLATAPPGRRVIEAANGVEALTLVRAGAVDMVISDIVLPRLDGLGLVDGIRRDPGLSHIPVLLISGQQAPEAGGGYGFLPKPFNARQLRSAVERTTAPRAPPPDPG